MSSKVELQTYAIEVVFVSGLRTQVISEDTFDVTCRCSDPLLAVVDGMQSKLDDLSRPGMLNVNPTTYSPHSAITAVQLKRMDVTRVLEVEWDEAMSMWDIINEE